MLFVRPGETGSLTSYLPESEEHFGVGVQAFIGATRDGPVDSFDFLVCTPRWFAEA
jgi:Immunity protein 8